MKNVPEKIWLQVDPGREAPESFDADGVTWCQDQIDELDVEYARSDLVTAEIEQLKKVAAASEKLRYLMHIKGFEGTEECGAHLDLLDAMHDAGLPCAAKGRDRETTKDSQ